MCPNRLERGAPGAQLSLYVRAVLRNGATDDGILDVVSQAVLQAGAPRAVNAARTIDEHLAEQRQRRPPSVTESIVDVGDHDTLVWDNGGDSVSSRSTSTAPPSEERSHNTSPSTSVTGSVRWRSSHRLHRAGSSVGPGRSGEQHGMETQIAETLIRRFSPRTIAENGWAVRYARESVRRNRVQEWAAAWRATAELDVLDRLAEFDVPSVAIAGAPGRVGHPPVQAPDGGRDPRLSVPDPGSGHAHDCDGAARRPGWRAAGVPTRRGGRLAALMPGVGAGRRGREPLSARAGGSPRRPPARATRSLRTRSRRG